MTRNEKLLVSAYTGVLICDYQDFLAYAGEILEKEIQISDLQQQAFWDNLKLKVSAEFGALGDTSDTPESDWMTGGTELLCTNCQGNIQTDRTVHVTAADGIKWKGVVTLRCEECGRRYESPVSLLVLEECSNGSDKVLR